MEQSLPEELLSGCWEMEGGLTAGNDERWLLGNGGRNDERRLLGNGGRNSLLCGGIGLVYYSMYVARTR